MTNQQMRGDFEAFREDFEAFYEIKPPLTFDRVSKNGNYRWLGVQNAWEVWQIAAAQSAETIARQSDIIAGLELELGSMKSAATFANDVIARLEADNSRLSKILQRASTDEENSLREQLAAAQADNVRLRHLLGEFEYNEYGPKRFPSEKDLDAALSQPISTNALEAYVESKLAEAFCEHESAPDKQGE